MIPILVKYCALIGAYIIYKTSMFFINIQYRIRSIMPCFNLLNFLTSPTLTFCLQFIEDYFPPHNSLYWNAYALSSSQTQPLIKKCSTVQHTNLPSAVCLLVFLFPDKPIQVSCARAEVPGFVSLAHFPISFHVNQVTPCPAAYPAVAEIYMPSSIFHFSFFIYPTSKACVFAFPKTNK